MIMNKGKKTRHQDSNILQYNIDLLDKQALEQSSWSEPVSSDLILAAKKGQWQIHITQKPFLLIEKYLSTMIATKSIKA